ncbi:MAG: hypothetical protein IOD12_17140 [Silvanigrellales bacterium]|jgi:hypothetical protein|nr:hypothetical protein [Silvanigrellales bacterium]
MLKLPKSWEADPDREKLLALLEGAARTLRADGTLRVPHLPLTDGFKSALAFARRCGKMRGGLENIETLLQREEAGFIKLAARGQDTRPQALTRILVVSDDGSDRFYRHCESLVTRYAPRILCVRLALSSPALGETFFGKETVVKALLVEQKEYVQRVLKGMLLSS